MQPSCDAIRPGLREVLIISASSRYFKVKYSTLKLIARNRLPAVVQDQRRVADWTSEPPDRGDTMAGGLARRRANLIALSAAF
jgi:hypothetical protein